MNRYLPEGMLYATKENRMLTGSLEGLTAAMNSGAIIEGRVSMCDGEHNLHIELPCRGVKAIIPREEGAIGIADGSTKDIALITKVSKPVCFKVERLLQETVGGEVTALLSRRRAQEECMSEFIGSRCCGDIIRARVTHLEQFGCFVDVGCGIPSLIPIYAISVSRISHPSDRFYIGQNIYVIIKSLENDRIWLSHKELLGTWGENAALFNNGETVSGTVRSVEDYGVFIELTPNLAGLAEPRDCVYVGQTASVYIKAIIPSKMKIKLIIVDVFETKRRQSEMKYFFEGNHISSWIYSSPDCDRLIQSQF